MIQRIHIDNRDQWNSGNNIKIPEVNFMSDSQFKRQMFKIKCSDCGRDAEVPFQPKKIGQYIVKTVSRKIETIRDRYLEER